MTALCSIWPLSSQHKNCHSDEPDKPIRAAISRSNPRAIALPWPSRAFWQAIASCSIRAVSLSWDSSPSPQTMPRSRARFHRIRSALVVAMNLPSQAVTVTKYKTATETQSILAKPIYPQKQPRQGPKFALQRTQWVWWIVPLPPIARKAICVPAMPFNGDGTAQHPKECPLATPSACRARICFQSRRPSRSTP